MRARLLLFLLVNILVLGFLLHLVWTLLSLLVVTGAADAITREELPALDSSKSSRPLGAEKKPVIPKIIHQTYKTEKVPKVWQEAQQSCKDLHKGWEYKFWTDDLARKFIADEYEWFLPTWDAYPFGIERADAIRYFLLHHYGGVYIDLDDGCKRPLDPLLSYPAFLRRTRPTGISNDAMGSPPHHPFFNRTIHALQSYNRSWFAPYITVMSSTGPLFLSLIWRHHNTWLHSSAFDSDLGLDAKKLGEAATETVEREREKARVRLLFPDEYMGKEWSFFTHHKGDSWHKWDSDALFWMRAHWAPLTVVGFVVAGFVFAGMWLCFRRLCGGRVTVAAGGGSPRAYGKGAGGGGILGWWRRRRMGRRRRVGRKEYVELRERDEED